MFHTQGLWAGGLRFLIRDMQAWEVLSRIVPELSPSSAIQDSRNEKGNGSIYKIPAWPWRWPVSRCPSPILLPSGPHCPLRDPCPSQLVVLDGAGLAPSSKVSA